MTTLRQGKFFMRAALRPCRGQIPIMVEAHKYIGKRYDNELEDNDDEYYCHEFVATVLNNCNFGIEKVHASALFGLIQKDIYCASSFVDNCHLYKIMEIDWKVKS